MNTQKKMKIRLQKTVTSFLRQLVDDTDWNVHCLIVDEDNVEQVEIRFESFDNLEIEESDFQNGTGILQTVAHVLCYQMITFVVILSANIN